MPAHITVSHPGRSWTQFSMYSWVARMLTFLIQYCTTYLSACTSCRCLHSNNRLNPTLVLQPPRLTFCSHGKPQRGS